MIEIADNQLEKKISPYRLRVVGIHEQDVWLYYTFDQV